MFNYNQAFLVRRPLVFRDGRLNRATVFPMFDVEGEVKSLLVVDHVDGRLFALLWTPGLIYKPWFQVFRVERSLKALEEVTLEQAYELSELWHFDPWWLLAEPDFATKEEAPILKHTNCVSHLTGVEELSFTADLSRISYGRVKDAGGVQIRSVQEMELPLPIKLAADKNRTRAASLRQGEWQLRPFWNRRQAV